MSATSISYQQSGYFTNLILDYLEQKPELRAFYHRFPTIENFKEQFEEKKQNYPENNRQILVSSLEQQYSGFEISEATQSNIRQLKNNNTFTITTGHQLNLFTGPLYFLYKIVSTIKLCDELNKAYPDSYFVPVYWMATEDHDFEEINHFNFKNIKIKWEKDSKGPVGRLATKELQKVLNVLAEDLGPGQNAEELTKLFENAYLNHSRLSDATRYLVNELFENKGLVIIDGDDVILKKLFVPFVQNELTQQTAFREVSTTDSALKKSYEIQVNPREINLFYIEDNLRERIVFENDQYKVLNTNLIFSEKEIIGLLENHPEKFSPNVLLRPLYQEVVLPNLCYIGGGGELAYWLQLQSLFKAHQVTFPILVLRNSALIANQKQAQKATKLQLSWADLFTESQELFNRKTKEFSQFDIDFSKQKQFLLEQFQKLRDIAAATDPSFAKAVQAQEAKQIKGLENLEKRLLKAEKHIYSEKLERILLLQNELFPGQSLQERKANFSEFYLEYGPEFIERLFAELNPLRQEFTIITL